MEDIKKAIESIQTEGKEQFDNAAKAFVDLAASQEKAQEELGRASKNIEKLSYRFDDLISLLSQNQAKIQAEVKAEHQNTDSFGVAEFIILCVGIFWIGLVISVFRRWIRYQFWDKDYLQRCCKNPEILSKLNFPLKGCGCPKWKYCQCLLPPPADLGDGGGDLLGNSSFPGDVIVSVDMLKNTSYKNL